MASSSPPHSRRLSRASENSASAWTEAHEQLAERWKRHALYHQVMHMRASRYYQARHRILGASAVGIGSLTAFIQFGTYTLTGTWIRVVSGGLVLIVAVLTAIQNFLRLSDESRNHKEESTKYAEVVRDIQECLAHSRTERENPRIFLSRTKDHLMAFQRDNILVPQHIVDEFYSDVVHVLSKEGYYTGEREEGIAENPTGAAGTSPVGPVPPPASVEDYKDPHADRLDRELERYQLSRLNTAVDGFVGSVGNRSQ